MDVSEELELAQKLLNLKKGCVGNEKYRAFIGVLRGDCRKRITDP